MADGFARLLDAYDAGPGAAPSATSTAASSARAGSTPRLKPAAETEDLKCDRVNRKTYDCTVRWRSRGAATATTGRYRFVRSSEKWVASGHER
jgi:hypothetical protein